MRRQLDRLRKYNSTKGERRIAEILKKNRIKFQTKVKLGKYEADFVIGRMILEVDGNIHRRANAVKDTYFASLGYVPVHISTYAKDSEHEILYLITANNYGR